MAMSPVHYPSCEEPLSISKLNRMTCDTEVSGLFATPVFMQLDQDDQEFALQFMLNSGSLKEMAGEMGKSYPIVLNMLDGLIQTRKRLNHE